MLGILRFLAMGGRCYKRGTDAPTRHHSDALVVGAIGDCVEILDSAN